MTLQLTLTFNGLTPYSPLQLRTDLVADIAATNQGFTDNLPAELVEDFTSTAIAAIAQCQHFAIDAVNSISYSFANEKVLMLLAAERGLTRLGLRQAVVSLTFTGTAGYYIKQGFKVSNASKSWLFATDTAVTVPLSGTVTVTATAITQGACNAQSGTLVTLIDTVVSPVTLTVVNLSDAIAGDANDESIESFRSRVLASLRSPTTGFTTAIRNAINSLPNIVPRLTSIKQVGFGYMVLASGADDYAIANAIFTNMFDTSILLHSADVARNKSVTIIDTPDQYPIRFVTPIQQLLTISVSWSETYAQAINDATALTLVRTAFVNYINSLVTGEPLNILELNRVFQDAVTPVLDHHYISNLSYSFTSQVGAFPAAPVTPSNYLLSSDISGYWYTNATNITVTRV